MLLEVTARQDVKDRRSINLTIDQKYITKIREEVLLPFAQGVEERLVEDFTPSRFSNGQKGGDFYKTVIEYANLEAGAVIFSTGLLDGLVGLSEKTVKLRRWNKQMNGRQQFGFQISIHDPDAHAQLAERLGVARLEPGEPNVLRFPMFRLLAHEDRGIEFQSDSLQEASIGGNSRKVESIKLQMLLGDMAERVRRSA